MLSLIPNYWERQDPSFEKDVVALTHVCRSWRALFISLPSLWNRLDFTNVDKTRTCIKRSKSSPLEVVLCKAERRSSIEDSFLLAIPLFRRLQSFTFTGTPDLLCNILKHPTPPTPFLKELTIDITNVPAPVISNTFFNNSLPSLRILKLTRVVIHSPWKFMPSLTTFNLSHVPDGGITVAQLLNIFESAPQLRHIRLTHSIPSSSNVLPGRVVRRPRLETLAISADASHSTLLNHLSIPERALLNLDFDFGGDESPLLQHLPKTAKNLRNLFCITAINLHFNETMKFAQLVGPTGRLCISGHWKDWDKTTPPPDLDRRILLSLNYFSLHMTRRLAIMKYEPPTLTRVDESPPHKVLLRMTALRTLTLTQCNNLPFILALNPRTYDPKMILGPRLEEVIIYVEKRDAFHVPELVDMAKERVLVGAGLRSVTIVGLGELVPGKEVFKLRDYVGHVDYRFEDVPPKWDTIPEDFER